jgi:hypothetical protein
MDSTVAVRLLQLTDEVDPRIAAGDDGQQADVVRVASIAPYVCQATMATVFVVQCAWLTFLGYLLFVLLR